MSETDIFNAEASRILTDKIAEAREQWAGIQRAVENAQRVLLWGPPGTGKSFVGVTRGVSSIEETCRLYLTLDTPASEIRGHFVPSESGGFRWHDGPAITAWRHGRRLVIDEIDAASGDTLTVLLGILDDPETAGLTLPSNESIRPSAGFSCVATTNQLPTVLPEALLDRFDVVCHVTKPHPDVFGTTLWSSPAIAEAAKRAIFLRPKGRDGLDEPIVGAHGRNVGLRAFRSLDRLVNKGFSPRDAAETVLGKEAGSWFSRAVALAA